MFLLFSRDLSFTFPNRTEKPTIGNLNSSTAYSDKYDAAALVGVGCLQICNMFYEDTENPPEFAPAGTQDYTFVRLMVTEGLYASRHT